MKNIRAYNWLLILYPNEDLTHKQAFDYILSHYKYYAYIKHDNDYNDLGELKKEHYHFVIKFNSQRYLNAIAEELNILPNYLEKCENLDSSLKYLIHFDDKEKTQYEVSQVHGTLQQRLINLLQQSNMSEPEKVLYLLKFIDDYPTKLSLRDFLEYVCFNDMYDVYRRSAITFQKLIEAQNYKIWELYHK